MTSKTREDELKPKKLIWKGTVAEGIKLGKFTQEEVDEWDSNDDLAYYLKRAELKGIAEGKKDKLAFGKEMYDKGKEVGESKGYAKALADELAFLNTLLDNEPYETEMKWYKYAYQRRKELKQSIKELGK